MIVIDSRSSLRQQQPTRAFNRLKSFLSCQFVILCCRRERAAKAEPLPPKHTHSEQSACYTHTGISGKRNRIEKKMFQFRSLCVCVWGGRAAVSVASADAAKYECIKQTNTENGATKDR